MLSLLAALTLTLSAAATPAPITVPETTAEADASVQDCQTAAAGRECYKICDWGWLYHPCNFDPLCSYYDPDKSEGTYEDDEDDVDTYDWDTKSRLADKTCVTICSLDPHVTVTHDCAEKDPCGDDVDK